MTRKRRGRGEGSVFKRADGRWVCNVSFGYDGNGKRQRRTVYGKTKQEAIERLKAVTKKGADSLKDTDRLTVGAFLDYWLEVRVKPSLAASTHDRYATIVRVQLKPHLGAVRLAKLLAGHVEMMLAKMKEDGESDRARKMSAVVLGTALRFGVKKKKIASNVCAEVERPGYTQPKMKVWDAEQCQKFLAATSSHRLHALFVLALTTGMRQGELFGLHWPDVDFANGMLSVNQQLCEVRGVVFLGELKTVASRRAITLPKVAVNALHDHRKRQLAAGHDVKDGPLFLAANGALLRKSNFIRYDYNPLVRASGLPRIRFHDLRHSAASLLMAQGVNPKVVQERLGHAKIETTMDTYSHVSVGMQKAVADRLDEMFG